MTDTRNTRWYLDIMSPNTKGEKFAWLDPTSIYINGDAFTQLLDDLTADLESVDCDVVAGLDAMGFVLGAALATRIGVDSCRSARPANYALIRTRVLHELFRPDAGHGNAHTGLCRRNPVLLVDQWIETGGTMDGAIRLVERQGGIVAGIATIAMEDNDRTAGYRAAYPVVTAVQPVQTFRNNATVRRWIPSQATSRKWPFRNFVDAQCSGETSLSVAPYRRGGPSNQFRFFLDRDFGD